MRLTRPLLVLCLILFFIPSLIFCQDKKSKKDEKSKPIALSLNLMVLDSNNKYADVNPADLKIFEDGVEQKLAYFVKKEPVLNIGLVFDNSGSLRQSLPEIISVGKVIVANLSPQDEAFVIRFINSDKIEITQDWTSNQDELNEAIDNLFVEGGQTAILDAIYLSAEKILERERNDKSKRYGIVLISDAEDRDSFYKLNEVAKLFQDTDIQIFLLSYAENAPLDKKNARRLSNLIPLEIGGMVYSLPKKHSRDELISSLKSVTTELRSNYIIGYISTNSIHNGLPRKLTIEVADGAKGEKRHGIIRESFIVPKD